MASDSGVRVSTGAKLDEAEADEVAEKVTWMLGLEQDFSQFYALCREEPKLGGVEAEAKGRLLRSPTLFEDIVKTILTTNTAWSGTKRMVNALVEAYGASADVARVDGEDGERAFPSPAALAGKSEAELREVGKLGYRAPYVLELAQRVTAGELDLGALKAPELSMPELRKRLLGIKGVGAYAAATLLMLLGRYDYLPMDSYACSAVSREWYDGEPVGEQEIEAAFAKWGEWKGLAYWFWEWSETA